MARILLVWVLLWGGLVLSTPVFADPANSTENTVENSGDHGVTAHENQEDSFHLDNDPFQGFNRVMFNIHNVLDGTLMGPMANIYQDGTPAVIKDGISNFLNNIKQPWTLVNDTLQGEGGKTLVTFSRFMINTIFGLFGLFDVAGHLGLEGHQSHFGQTLGTWGVPAGPYVFLPVLGPNSLRSLAGLGVGFVGSPSTYFLLKAHRSDLVWTTIVIDGLVKRVDSIPIINDLQENSLDYYIAMRSSYLQYEAGQTTGQKNELQPNPEDFLSD
jgi:phospholipid-binding lipoprotein MlaA